MLRNATECMLLFVWMHRYCRQCQILYTLSTLPTFKVRTEKHKTENIFKNQTILPFISFQSILHSVTLLLLLHCMLQCFNKRKNRTTTKNEKQKPYLFIRSVSSKNSVECSTIQSSDWNPSKELNFKRFTQIQMCDLLSVNECMKLDHFNFDYSLLTFFTMLCDTMCRLTRSPFFHYLFSPNVWSVNLWFWFS